MAVHLAEERRQKGQPFLMPQTERALVAHGILSRFLKTFLNLVSVVTSLSTRLTRSQGRLQGGSGRNLRPNWAQGEGNYTLKGEEFSQI